MDYKKLIAEIEQRFGIALSVSIFFPVLLSAYFAVAGGVSQPENITFFFFLFVGLYLFAYVAFQFIKHSEFPSRALTFLNWAVLLGIACYILPIIFLVMTANGKTPLTWAILADAEFFKVSLWGMMIVAGIVASEMFLGLFYLAWTAGSKAGAKSKAHKKKN